MQPRLEGEVADPARDRQSALAGLDAARRIERALQHAKVCVAAACRLQQVVVLGQRDALLDPLHCVGELAHARQATPSVL